MLRVTFDSATDKPILPWYALCGDRSSSHSDRYSCESQAGFGPSSTSFVVVKVQYGVQSYTLMRVISDTLKFSQFKSVAVSVTSDI